MVPFEHSSPLPSNDVRCSTPPIPPPSDVMQHPPPPKWRYPTPPPSKWRCPTPPPSKWRCSTPPPPLKCVTGSLNGPIRLQQPLKQWTFWVLLWRGYQMFICHNFIYYQAQKERFYYRSKFAMARDMVLWDAILVFICCFCTWVNILR